jgi:hypothetical protein
MAEAVIGEELTVTHFSQERGLLGILCFMVILFYLFLLCLRVTLFETDVL